MELKDIRVKIDEIDTELVRLFKERMEISAKIPDDMDLDTIKKQS
jgi:chorismate mutase